LKLLKKTEATGVDKRQAEAVPTLNQIDTSAASIDSLDDEDFSFDLVPGDDCKDSLLAVQRLPVEDLFRPVCEAQQIDETSGKTINWDDIDNLLKAGTSTTTPTETGGFRLTEEACSRWVRDVLSQGGCEYHDIDVLVWLSAGVGDREILHTNLQREIEACGLIVERLSESAVSSLAANIDNIDAEEPLTEIVATEEGNQGFELSLEAQRSKAFRGIIAGLPHELRNMIIKRYGLESRESMTLAEIGLEYGVTRERIRQIQQKALKKLSKPAYSDILSEYR